MSTVERLLEHYALSSGEGESWYRESRRQARRIARETGVTLSTAAGLLAAYSPRVMWVVNVRLALETARDGVPTTGCMATSRANALRIVAGERPLAVMRGPKTREFYRAIMGDEDAAVIDVWMLRAMGEDPTKAPTAKRYDALASDLREAARRANIGTATFQAIVWTQVRGRAA